MDHYQVNPLVELWLWRTCALVQQYKILKQRKGHASYVLNNSSKPHNFSVIAERFVFFAVLSFLIGKYLLELHILFVLLSLGKYFAWVAFLCMNRGGCALWRGVSLDATVTVNLVVKLLVTRKILWCNIFCYGNDRQWFFQNVSNDQYDSVTSIITECFSLCSNNIIML